MRTMRALAALWLAAFCLAAQAQRLGVGRDELKTMIEEHA